MVRWEEAFTKRREREEPLSREEMFTAREERDYQVPEPPPSPEEPERTARFARKAPPKKKRQPYPPMLERIHNNLDEIWVNILLKSEQRPETLLICGATRGEGCLFTSFYLSLFLALGHGMRVLYVDTNVNAFAQNPYIPISPDHSGLASYFIENQSLSSLILGTEYDNFFVLPSGSGKVENKRQNVIMETEDLENLTSFCRNNFDITIFAGQPITMRPVMIEFAKVVDQLVLVCRYGFSRREVSRLAIEKLMQNNIMPLGIILNNRRYPVPTWVYRILK